MIQYLRGNHRKQARFSRLIILFLAPPNASGRSGDLAALSVAYFRGSPPLVPPGPRQSWFVSRLLVPKGTELGCRYLLLPALTFKSQKAGGDGGIRTLDTPLGAHSGDYVANCLVPSHPMNQLFSRSKCFLGAALCGPIPHDWVANW
jgi:hypothetical protein